MMNAETGAGPGSERVAGRPIRWLGDVRAPIGAVALLLLALHARLYMPFLADDALISLRYSARLIAGHGLTWSPGQPVEGYSNLLWVLLCAAYGALGGELIDGLRILGFLSIAAAVAAVLAAASGRRNVLPAIAGALTLVLSGSIAIWTIGGLEQALLAALFAWGIVLLYPALAPDGATLRRMVPVGILFGLLTLVRPDAPLLVVAALLGLLAARRFDRPAVRFLLGAGSIAALFWLCQLLFRISYYGELVPNTAHAKLAFSPARLADGINYVLKWGGSMLPLLLLIAAGLAAAGLASTRLAAGRIDDRARRRLTLLAVPLLLWCSYVALIGGDIFPGRRHMVVATAVVALAAVEAVRLLAMRSPRVALASTAAALLLMIPLQWIDPANREARAERWEWDGRVVGTLLKRAFGAEGPTIAVSNAGAVPYWSELPAIDMLGLNDHHIAHHPPADLGEGKIGHELGDGDYVLARRPDLVLLCDHVGGDTACFAGERRLLARPEFRRDYRLVTFEGEEPHTFRARIWARLASPRIGIARHAEELLIPGYLFGVGPGAVARLDDAGRIGCVVTRDAPGRLDSIELPAGEWRIAAEGSAAVRVVIESRDGENLPSAVPAARGDAEPALSGAVRVREGTRAVDIRLWPLDADSVHVRRLRLVRALPSR